MGKLEATSRQLEAVEAGRWNRVTLTMILEES
jgi:hypothetical protein